MFTVAAAPRRSPRPRARVAGKTRAVSASGVRAASARRGAALVARAGFTPAGAKSPASAWSLPTSSSSPTTTSPSLVETNDEWIKTRTGIGKRHVISGDESLTSLAAAASRDALEMAGVAPAGRRPHHPRHLLPDDVFGSACTLQAAIGAEGALAYDITAACSGFVVGLVNGVHFIRGGEYKNVLVVGADVLSIRRLARPRHVHPLRRRVRRHGADGDGETRGLLSAGF